MTERPNETRSELFQAEKFSDALITRISDTKKQITEVKTGIDWAPGDWLPDKEYECIEDLKEKINKDLLTLLSLRRETNLEQEIFVSIEMFPGEKIHPFSSNRIVVGVPSVDRPGSTYKIYANLTDLRGEGVSDSLEAIELIGENRTVVNSDIGTFMMKTNRELKRINLEMNLANKGNSKYSKEQLRALVKHLERQKQLRDFPQTSL